MGAVIFANSDALDGGGTLEPSPVHIPAAEVSGLDGATLEGLVGTPASLTVVTGNYAPWDGTSFAAPHVTGVAAAVWSQNLKCGPRDIRALLDYTAHDLETAGRDADTGDGLVDMQRALAHLDCDGTQEACTLRKAGAACTSMSDCCSGFCDGRSGRKTCR